MPEFPELDFDIDFGYGVKPSLSTNYVIEGPADMFVGEDFYDGVGKPLLAEWIEPIQKPDVADFEEEIALLSGWKDTVPDLLEVYDMPEPPMIDDFFDDEYSGLLVNEIYEPDFETYSPVIESFYEKPEINEFFGGEFEFF